MGIKKVLSYTLLFFFVFVVLIYYIHLTNGFLLFSDAAKFADIARNFEQGMGYVTNFMFPGGDLLKVVDKLPIYQPWQPPVMPLLISLSFKLSGVSDISVIAVSVFFNILTAVFLVFIGELLFGGIAGLLLALVYLFSIIFINYAATGASETVFVFEIVFLFYLLLKKSKYNIIFAPILLLSLYFTRPQAFIYILGAILFWLITNLNLKKAVIIFFTVLFVGFLIDKTILTQLNGRFFLYSITSRGVNAFSSIASDQSPTFMLSGGVIAGFNILMFVKKVFYNLYNFYKLMPQIMNPYLFVLFVISMFRWGKNKLVNAVKISTIFMVVLTFLVTAATIPFFRYLHPVVPLIYLFSIETMVWIVGKIYEELKGTKIKIRKEVFVPVVSFVLVMVFAVGPTMGVIFLDSRFERKTHNVGKPPVYALLSWKLKDDTLKDDVIVTNLDTWGSWYGERKTVWFPLEPKQLLDPATGKIPFDAIYLTSYLMNDENYFMGDSWRQIYTNPKDPNKWTCTGCKEIADEFVLKGIYDVPAETNYQKEGAKAILLVKK